MFDPSQTTLKKKISLSEVHNRLHFPMLKKVVKWLSHWYQMYGHLIATSIFGIYQIGYHFS